MNMPRRTTVSPRSLGGLPFLIQCSCWLLLLTWLPTARGDTGSATATGDQPITLKSIVVGFDGHYKVGYWTPVRVTLSGGSQSLVGQLELTVVDGDNTRSTVRTGPRQILPGQETVVTSFVKFGQPDGELQLQFRSEDDVVWQRTIGPDPDEDGTWLPEAMSTSQQLYVMVGSSLGVEDAIGIQQRELSAEIQLAKLADASELPQHWYGYEGVDALFCTAGQPELFRSLRPDSAALVALTEWVDMGGLLVLAAGANPEALQGQGPFAKLVPGRIETMATLRITMALESYSGGSQQVPVSKSGARLNLAVPQLEAARGSVEVTEAGLPLVVRAPHGLGQVVFVALDLDRTPLAGWAGRGALINRLLRKTPPPGAVVAADSWGGNSLHLGFDDLSGQLRGALDQFQGIKLISFGTIFGLLCVYILLIGPVDYLIVKKVFRRMEATWITFPITVIAFSAAAYFLAIWWKGDQLRINQVELVDVDLESGLVRGTTWANMFTPETASYNLSLKPLNDEPSDTSLDQSPVLFSWLGLPGQGAGGMMRSGVRPQMFTRAYTYSPALDQMLGTPVAVWSSKSLTARWRQPVNRATALETDLSAGPDQVLQGSVINGTSQPLKDCILVYDRWAYELGDLEPGQSARMDASDRQLDLQTVLKDITLEKNAKNEYGRRSTPYDPTGHDVLKILKQMIFYDVSGGASYTGLSNNYQHFVDGSSQLAMGRAILVGTVDQPATQLQHDGKELNAEVNRKTLYRFMIPVEREAVVE